MSDKTELLPCPFCEIRVTLISGREDIRVAGSHGKRCPFRDVDVIVDGREAWNTRAALAEDVRAMVDESVSGPNWQACWTDWLANNAEIDPDGFKQHWSGWKAALRANPAQQPRTQLFQTIPLLPHPPRHWGFLEPNSEVPGYTLEQVKEYGAACIAAFAKHNPQ